MADIDFDAVGGTGGHKALPPLKDMINWAGGAMSLALVAGLGVWGYQIMVRDVSGVPVVRALEGPIRVAPEDPGGSQAANQGLAVNRVTAEGEAAPPADTLRLAPRPVDLTEEDRAASALNPPAMTTYPDESIAAPAPVEAAMVPGETPALAAPEVVDDADLAALPEPEIEEIVPLMELPEGALSRSLRPRHRPAGIDMDMAAAAAIAAATASLAPRAVADLPADEVIAGTALVQLGAFDDTDEARTVWEDLAARGQFSGFFDDKSRVIQSADSGGRTFYRLRAAGFADIADARRFCAALVAEGADCIPVVAR